MSSLPKILFFFCNKAYILLYLSVCQALDTVYVGPVPEGRHMFVFQADPPNPEKIPEADLVGVTVVLLTCSYRSAGACRGLGLMLVSFPRVHQGRLLCQHRLHRAGAEGVAAFSTALGKTTEEYPGHQP